MAKERHDLKPYVGEEAHCDRLALGAHGEEPKPGLRAGGRAARHPPSCSPPKTGKEAYVEPVVEERRLPLHGEGGQAEGHRGGEATVRSRVAVAAASFA